MKTRTLETVFIEAKSFYTNREAEIYISNGGEETIEVTIDVLIPEKKIEITEREFEEAVRQIRGNVFDVYDNNDVKQVFKKALGFTDED